MFRIVANLIIFASFYFSMLSLSTLTATLIIEILIVGPFTRTGGIMPGAQILILFFFLPINLVVFAILWHSTSTNKKNKIIVFLGILLSIPSFIFSILLFILLFTINDSIRLNENPFYNMIRSEGSHYILSTFIVFFIRSHIVFFNRLIKIINLYVVNKKLKV